MFHFCPVARVLFVVARVFLCVYLDVLGGCQGDMLASELYACCISMLLLCCLGL